MRKSAGGFFQKVTPRKLIRKSASRPDLRFHNEKICLEKVFGLTTANTNGIACNSVTGVIAYPAGCVIVLFNPKTNLQNHIINQEKKTITCVNFSADGKYLVSGECGHQPLVRVWELADTSAPIAELKGHKSGIISVEFSPNQKLLVSIGDHHDMLVNIWNWKNGHTVACNKSGCKVRSVSFNEKGNYLVTVGNRHVKFWYLDTETTSRANVPLAPITGRSGILGDQRNNCFTDVKCGKGKNATYTYCVTKSGLLCLFSEKRILDKWVQLKAGSTNCLVVTEHYVFCGCSDGIIRVFNPTELKFIATLPVPHKLGINVCDNIKSPQNKDNSQKHCADVVALAVNEYYCRLTSVYNDHSMYIWDVHDVKNVFKQHSFLYHSACIWGLETYSSYNNPCLPNGSFLTCSSDDTIRIWNIDDEPNDSEVYFRNMYSKELLKIVYVDEGLMNLQDTSMLPLHKDTDCKNGVRCMQISPDGQHCATGDRSGNLRIYNLQFFDEIFRIEAHEAEILCVEFSDPKSGYRLLGTSSRDRLVHIFDANNEFILLQTIDDHSSSITAVRFNYDSEVLQLLSCGADKVVMFHTGQVTSSGSIFFVRNTIVPGKATLFDMGIEPTRKFAATVGQDRNMRIYDIQGAKQLQCFKGSTGEGNLIKFQLDPAGMYAAISCSDKTIAIYDFNRGECEATILGHSELVTSLKFTDDGKRLISVSGDGCIFVWTLPQSFTENILSRLQELDLPLPKSQEVSDPRRKTFVISSPNVSMNDNFQTPTRRPPIGYRFSVGQLPVWAQKQIGVEGSETLKSNAPSMGRWGEVTDGPLQSVQEIQQQNLVLLSRASNGVFDPHGSVNSMPNDSRNHVNERTFQVTENKGSHKGSRSSKGEMTNEDVPYDSESAESATTVEDESESEEENDANSSPLSQHFEKLATPMISKVLAKTHSSSNYNKNASGMLGHRASISAKFLSHSQRPARNSSYSVDEQRRKLDALKAKLYAKTNQSPLTRKSSIDSTIINDFKDRSKERSSNLKKAKLFSRSCQNISQLNDIADDCFDKRIDFVRTYEKSDRRSSTPLNDKAINPTIPTQNAWTRRLVSPITSPTTANVSSSETYKKRDKHQRRPRPKSMLIESLSCKQVREEASSVSDVELLNNGGVPDHWTSKRPEGDKSRREIDIDEQPRHESSKLSRMAAEIEANVREMNFKANFDDKYCKDAPIKEDDTLKPVISINLNHEFSRIELPNMDSPPERDVALLFNGRSSEKVEQTEGTGTVSVDDCQSILKSLVQSYNDVRVMQSKILDQPHSPFHTQLVSLISKTYTDLESNMCEQRGKLNEHLDLFEDQNDVIMSLAYQELQDELVATTTAQDSGHNMLAMLDKYSNLLVEIASSKMREKVVSEV